MKVRQLMTERPATISPESAIKEAARLMIERHVSGLPVVDDEGLLVGIVSEADVVHQESLRNPVTTIRGLWRRVAPKPQVTNEVMTRRVVTIGPDADHTEAARLMESAGVKRLPVVDDHSKLVGIISRGDILEAFARLDSEIHDEVESTVVERILWLDSDTLEIAVTDGRVKLGGRVPTRSDIRILEEMTMRVDGVVAVDASDLSYDIDDTSRAY